MGGKLYLKNFMSFSKSFRDFSKKTLTFLENFKFFQTKDFELSEKGNCLFHTKF